MFLQKLLNIFFPLKCIICRSLDTENYVCYSCWSKVNFITRPYCKICSFPFLYEELHDAICGQCIKRDPVYDRLISVMKYDEYSKKIIHRFKYQDKLEITQYLSDLMLGAAKEIIGEIDYIIPVPMHRYKLLKRGFNQAALLARVIARKAKKKYLPDLLIKVKNSKPQIGLNKNEREKNVKNAFKINESYNDLLENKSILLIDDVITTGATIEECCHVLRQIRRSKIYILSLARRI